MKVQKVEVGNKRIYLLIDDLGSPVPEVSKFMKYLFNKENSSNTLLTYSTALKHFYSYLNQIDSKFDSITINKLSNFVLWLRNPYENIKVIPHNKVAPKRSEKTVNLYLTAVTEFYRFLYRSDLIDSTLIEKLMTQINGGSSFKRYKGFLHHVTKDSPVYKNILKLKTPREKVQTYTKEQVQEIYLTATNIRDRFLVKLLFETGLRIGEVLSLFIEDFIFDAKIKNHKIKLVDRGELTNGGKLKTGERKIDISQDLVNLFDDYLYEVIDDLDVDHNFLFVKLRGNNAGQPMTYSDVYATLKEIERKLKFRITPHLFRHTHASLFYLESKNIKLVQERLGHSSIQTTMNLYVHLSEQETRKEWEKASGVFDFNSE
jgi:integrase